MAISKQRHEIYLAFRQTQQQNVNGLAFSLLLESFRPYRQFGNSGKVMRYVHSGFHRLWNSAGVGRDLRYWLSQEPTSTYTLWVSK